MRERPLHAEAEQQRQEIHALRPPSSERASWPQSNAGPGSVLRPGAMSLWPTMGASPQRRQRRSQRPHQSRQCVVLRRRIRHLVGALELDAHREVIAVLAAAMHRLARVPGAPGHGHVLHQLAVATDEEVGRHLQAGYLRERGMRRRVQPVREQGVDPGPAELARRQRDAVHDDQVGHDSRPAVRRSSARAPGAPRARGRYGDQCANPSWSWQTPRRRLLPRRKSPLSHWLTFRSRTMPITSARP